MEVLVAGHRWHRAILGSTLRRLVAGNDRLDLFLHLGDGKANSCKRSVCKNPPPTYWFEFLGNLSVRSDHLVHFLVDWLRHSVAQNVSLVCGGGRERKNNQHESRIVATDVDDHLPVDSDCWWLPSAPWWTCCTFNRLEAERKISVNGTELAPTSMLVGCTYPLEGTS